MKKIFLLSIITLLQGAGIGSIFPVLTQEVLSRGANPTMTPMIFSLYSLASLFSAIFWGRLSDAFGRRRILIIVAIGTTLSYVFLSMATSLFALFSSRAFAGAFNGWIVCALAYVADCTSKKDRAKGMGLVGSFFAMGFVLGPLITAFIVVGGKMYLAAVFASILSLISIFMVIFLIEEPARRSKRDSIFLKELWSIPTVHTIVYLAFALNLIFTMVEGTYVLYIYKLFSTTVRDVGYVLFLSGVFHILAQGGVANVLIRRYGEGATIVFSVFIAAAGLVTVIYIGAFGIYIPMAFIGVSMGLFAPAINTIASKEAPENLRGSMIGAVQTSQSGARVFGPAVAGIFMSGKGNLLVLPYVAALLLSIVPVLLLRRLSLERRALYRAPRQ